MREFFLKEYDKIADAHFNVSQRITSFFQYMIAVYAAPLILVNEKIVINDEIKGLIFILISVVGFFICMYVNQLRCESLLYARTVNAMRNYAFDKKGSISNGDQKYLTLPIQKSKPSFIDKTQFIWIVYTASLANSGYCIFGISFLKQNIKNLLAKIVDSNRLSINNSLENIIYLALFLILFFLQVHLYYIFTRKVEYGLNEYKQRIGTDIDGVIGYHEKGFCDMYNDKYIKINETKIEPSQITRIPVSKINELSISEEQERDIFNDKNYWINMPIMEGAVQTIEKIHNIFGYEVYFFSWRDWGNELNKHCKETFDIKKITVNWLKINGIHKTNKIKEIVNKKLLSKEYHMFHASTDSSEKKVHEEKISKLVFNKYLYKKLYLEKGNYNLPVGIKGSLYKNRYYFSQSWKIKYFVEDEPLKAIKLATICQYVFLIEHPYNMDCNNLPFNVIKVKSWPEIYDKIKELG